MFNRISPHPKQFKMFEVGKSLQKNQRIRSKNKDQAMDEYYRSCDPVGDVGQPTNKHRSNSSDLMETPSKRIHTEANNNLRDDSVGSFGIISAGCASASAVASKAEATIAFASSAKKPAMVKKMPPLSNESGSHASSIVSVNPD